MSEHLEFVVEFKDGTRDWIDPVESIVIDDNTLVVDGWDYNLEDVDKWTIRPYTPETTYDPIEEEIHEI